MTKFVVVAAVAIAGMLVNSESAFAGRRCCRVRQCCAVQTTCCNTGCNTGCNANGCNAGGCNAAPVYDNNANPAAPTPPIETPTAQANGYQSYSYEPGVAPVGQPAMTVGTVQPYRYYSTSSYTQFRGDRKALGNY